MTTEPVITTFTRHRIDCSHAGDEFYKRCSCWKHLRWSYGGKQYRKATKQRTWTGAERFKREVELAYEKAGQPAGKDEPVTVRQAIEIFSRDKASQGLTQCAGKIARGVDRVVLDIDDAKSRRLRSNRQRKPKGRMGRIARW